MRGPPLHIPIPDTIIVDTGTICRIRNDKKGRIVFDQPRYDLQLPRDTFIQSCVESFVADSVPFGQSSQMMNLKKRFVAVIKRPCPSVDAQVTNSVECLIPLSFQAHLLESMDTNTGKYVMQKFIKGRGGSAGTYRVFWRATSCGAGASGTVSGWFISQTSKRFKLQK